MDILRHVLFDLLIGFGIGVVLGIGIYYKIAERKVRCIECNSDDIEVYEYYCKKCGNYFEL